MITTIATAITVLAVAALAWDGFRRYLGYRAALLTQRSELTALREELLARCDRNKLALENLAKETHDELTEMKSKAANLALARSGQFRR